MQSTEQIDRHMALALDPARRNQRDACNAPVFARRGSIRGVGQAAAAKGRSRGGAPTITPNSPPPHYRSTPTPIANTDLGEVVGISIGGWFSLALRGGRDARILGQ